MSRPLTQDRVKEESADFLGTCGESATATQSHFQPAFQNPADGCVVAARFPSGAVAPMHLICGLPKTWGRKFDQQGNVVELIDGIVAGFVRAGSFYTREEAAYGAQDTIPDHDVSVIAGPGGAKHSAGT